MSEIAAEWIVFYHITSIREISVVFTPILPQVTLLEQPIPNNSWITKSASTIYRYFLNKNIFFKYYFCYFLSWAQVNSFNVTFNSKSLFLILIWTKKMLFIVCFFFQFLNFIETPSSIKIFINHSAYSLNFVLMM